METLFIPNENDFKKWIKEAVSECLVDYLQNRTAIEVKEEGLLNRREIAKCLRISLVTLTDWVKLGLPSHRQGGRIYFDKKEVLDYIKEKKMQQCGVGSKLHHLRQEIA